MEYINLNNKEYKLVIGNGKDDKFRASFNNLTKKTFRFDFEAWYQEGYWKEQYIPYSLIEGEEVISNVSVNIIDISIFGEAKRLIQLGTVMTDKNYRNQGLIRMLIDKIIVDWQDKCDFIYLFANNSVLDFYPKFGFIKYEQYQCEKEISEKHKEFLETVSMNGHKDEYLKKLNMSDSGNREFLYRKVNSSKLHGQISMIGNAELILFYCIDFMKDNVYYIEEYDLLVIAGYQQDTLEIYDVFCKDELSLDNIVACMLRKETNKVKLYFTPKEVDSYTITPLKEEDTLFILGKDTMLLEKKQVMFPYLSHT